MLNDVIFVTLQNAWAWGYSFYVLHKLYNVCKNKKSGTQREILKWENID